LTKLTRAKKLEEWIWEWMINRKYPYFWHSQLTREALGRGARVSDVDRYLDQARKEGRIYWIKAFGRGCIGIKEASNG